MLSRANRRRARIKRSKSFDRPDSSPESRGRQNNIIGHRQPDASEMDRFRISLYEYPIYARNKHLQLVYMNSN
jgi:hypothetical protein